MQGKQALADRTVAGKQSDGLVWNVVLNNPFARRNGQTFPTGGVDDAAEFWRRLIRRGESVALVKPAAAPPTFGSVPIPKAGARHSAGLIADRAGNLYGTTAIGGIAGVVFKLSPAIPFIIRAVSSGP